MLLRHLIIEHDGLTIADELYLFVELGDRCIDRQCIINAAILIDLPLLVAHRISQQDDIDIAAFLAQIGYRSDILIAHILLEEYDKMLVPDMRRTCGCRLLVVLCQPNQTSRNVF